MTEQTTVEKAADVAECYFHDGTLHDKFRGRSRYESIAYYWEISRRELREELERRGLVLLNPKICWDCPVKNHASQLAPCCPIFKTHYLPCSPTLAEVNNAG